MWNYKGIVIFILVSCGEPSERQSTDPQFKPNLALTSQETQSTTLTSATNTLSHESIAPELTYSQKQQVIDFGTKFRNFLNQFKEAFVACKSANPEARPLLTDEVLSYFQNLTDEQIGTAFLKMPEERLSALQGNVLDQPQEPVAKDSGTPAKPAFDNNFSNNLLFGAGALLTGGIAIAQGYGMKASPGVTPVPETKSKPPKPIPGTSGEHPSHGERISGAGKAVMALGALAALGGLVMVGMGVADKVINNSSGSSPTPGASGVCQANIDGRQTFLDLYQQIFVLRSSLKAVQTK